MPRRLIYRHQQKQNPEHPKNTVQAPTLTHRTASFQLPQSSGMETGQLGTRWEALVNILKQNLKVRSEVGEEGPLSRPPPAVAAVSAVPGPAGSGTPVTGPVSVVPGTPATSGAAAAGTGTPVTPGPVSAVPGTPVTSGAASAGTVTTLQLAP